MITQLIVGVLIATTICAFSAWTIDTHHPESFKEKSIAALSAWVVINVIIALVLSAVTMWGLFSIIQSL